jgi:hypothetical protein
VTSIVRTPTVVLRLCSKSGAMLFPYYGTCNDILRHNSVDVQYWAARHTIDSPKAPARVYDSERQVVRGLPTSIIIR